MNLEALHPWIAIVVTISVFTILQVRRSTPLDLLFMMGLLVCAVVGILTPEEALAGFANPAVLTIGGLLAVSAALRYTGGLDWIGQKLLGRAENERQALWRLMISLIPASAFLLNTALVAMMAPVVVNWCRVRQIAPSRLLIPVSYLAILGGVCTLIGTSTTLVVNAKLRERHASELTELQTLKQSDPNAEYDGLSHTDAVAKQETLIESLEPMPLFELGKVGLPCALVGAVYMFFVAPRLLPDRRDLVDRMEEQPRQYLVEMLVQPNCPLVGRTVKDAGLRNLPGLFLIEIDRNERIMTPVTPTDEILAGDHLVFTGIVSTIVDLEKIPGLVPVESEDHDEITLEQRHLVEVVLSPASPLIRTTVRKANFRQRYNAAVLAVHRNGERIFTKIGDIVLQPGDTLLLQTAGNFYERHRHDTDFYLVSGVDEAEQRAPQKMKLALTIFVGLLIWLVLCSFFGSASTASWASPAIASFVAVVLLVVTRCVRMPQVRKALDIRLLATIACALGVGLALEKSGAALMIAENVVNWVGADQKLLLLIAIYILAMILTEMVTNNAVAALLFPIAVDVAIASGVDPRPFVMAISLAASLAFVTPIGYQTNLMVMGPGGYQPRDFVKCGLPLSIIVATTAVLLIPVMWPF